jgi:hypothetical protein
MMSWACLALLIAQVSVMIGQPVNYGAVPFTPQQLSKQADCSQNHRFLQPYKNPTSLAIISKLLGEIQQIELVKRPASDVLIRLNMLRAEMRNQDNLSRTDRVSVNLACAQIASRFDFIEPRDAFFNAALSEFSVLSADEQQLIVSTFNSQALLARMDQRTWYTRKIHTLNDAMKRNAAGSKT